MRELPVQQRTDRIRDPLKLSVVEMVKTGTTLTAQEVFFKDQPNEKAPLTDRKSVV